MIVQIPLVRPTHPGYFRWQRYTTAAKLPPEIRGVIEPRKPGQFYYLALGGAGGFSGGNVQYPHRMSSTPIEFTLDDELVGGLKIDPTFLYESWVPSSSDSTIVTQSFVHVLCGRYEVDSLGNQKWVTSVDKTVPNADTLTIPESDLVTCTHVRISRAEMRPILVDRATSTPAWEPIFIAPLCVVEIE